FPATYDFTVRTTSAQLVAQQLVAFRRNWAKVNLRYARSKNLTPYDVLTIASMIESETSAPEERQLVAAVVYNRLHQRMPVGLDWRYVPLEVAPPDLGEAVAGLVADRFAGANVTIPHKLAVVELCDEAEGDSVNTLVLRDGRLLGFNTDKEIVAGIPAERVCLIGSGGAARALLPALPGDVRIFSRSSEWLP